MKTKMQEELVNSFLTSLDDETRPLYHDIIMYLSELGYHPHKQRSYIVFKHDRHNKQMSKIGIKKKTQTPFFALRFSACRGYSQKFTDVVSSAIAKYPTRKARCLENECSYCRGEAKTRVYAYTFADGETKSHCGASALEIPDITVDDIGEIKSLIKKNMSIYSNMRLVYSNDCYIGNLT